MLARFGVTRLGMEWQSRQVESRNGLARIARAMTKVHPKGVSEVTLTEIEQSGKDFLAPADVAPVLGVHPYSLNCQAREDISKLGFPAMMVGTRVRIPRLGFLHWVRYGNTPENESEEKQ